MSLETDLNLLRSGRSSRKTFKTYTPLIVSKPDEAKMDYHIFQQSTINLPSRSPSPMSAPRTPSPEPVAFDLCEPPSRSPSPLPIQAYKTWEQLTYGFLQLKPTPVPNVPSLRPAQITAAFQLQEEAASGIHPDVKGALTISRRQAEDVALPHKLRSSRRGARRPFEHHSLTAFISSPAPAPRSATTHNSVNEHGPVASSPALSTGANGDASATPSGRRNTDVHFRMKRHPLPKGLNPSSLAILLLAETLSTISPFTTPQDLGAITSEIRKICRALLGYPYRPPRGLIPRDQPHPLEGLVAAEAERCWAQQAPTPHFPAQLQLHPPRPPPPRSLPHSRRDLFRLLGGDELVEQARSTFDQVVVPDEDRPTEKFRLALRRSNQIILPPKQVNPVTGEEKDDGVDLLTLSAFRLRFFPPGNEVGSGVPLPLGLGRYPLVEGVRWHAPKQLPKLL
eukprot:gnl/Dysnectes_brevis/884_a979_1481.p1 GENE.gnl/Dysnectes_brevis/884_a979_1481~~gnl/Dysnectes_brevis/884_a979_1481.p1  ORF type:complete len:452 (-),score=69.63 gnl/Dysnectes_brevis/884_a979_1481:141-1496(-)